MDKNELFPALIGCLTGRDLMPLVSVGLGTASLTHDTRNHDLWWLRLDDSAHALIVFRREIGAPNRPSANNIVFEIYRANIVPVVILSRGGTRQPLSVLPNLAGTTLHVLLRGWEAR